MIDPVARKQPVNQWSACLAHASDARQLSLSSLARPEPQLHGPFLGEHFEMDSGGTSLAVSDQDCPFQCRGAGLLPGWGGKIPHTSWPKNQNIKKKKQEQYSIKTLKMAHIKKIKLKKTWIGKKRSQREAAGWRGSGNPWHGTRGACRLSVLTPPRAVRGPGLVPVQSGKACCPPGGVRLEWRYH